MNSPIRTATPLFIVALLVSSAFGGLQLDNNFATPGTTISLGIEVINDSAPPVSWDVNVVAPVSFTISSIGTGTPPTFAGSDVPLASTGWIDTGGIGSIPPGSFLTTPAVTLPPNGSVQFASLGVVVPADFAGTFTLALVNDVEIASGLAGGAQLDVVTPADFAASNSTVTVAAIPEPNAFLFLGLIGTGVAGVRYVRRRKVA